MNFCLRSMFLILTSFSLGSGIASPAESAESSRPNVVIVITDDQGYGDLGCTGNPVVKTPNIDRLASESSALTDYHVAPTCSPTRSALMTGHWTNRTGVWHTINGRSMLRANEVTMGTYFNDAGYQTGMFGKWHLGDNYPYRPEDRGFTEVYRHGGGGVGQTPDVWDNAYFDGAYFHNGKVESAEGFCTDVFFEKAGDFIRNCADSKQPFLAYIATNAPHGPLHAPQKYMDMYSDQNDGIAAFFGMITNIDDNVGTTRKLIKELGIEDNTIFVFTTDNGTASGEEIFNAEMRGKKGSPYEGGHRVPFFMHWPDGGIQQKHESNTLCHAVDVVPTLMDFCGIEKPASTKFDGTSIRSLLEPNTPEALTDRMLVTDSQRVRDPIKWRQSSVMRGSLRLINGEELYDVSTDPGQQKNVAQDLPDEVAAMRAFYEAWWAELEPTFAETTEIVLGNPKHPSVSMTAHDWIQEEMPPWNQQQIRAGGGRKPKPPRGKNRASNKTPSLQHNGHWAVLVETPGRYEISVSRWPAEPNHPIVARMEPGENVPGASKAFRTQDGRGFPVERATLRVDGKALKTLPVNEGDVAMKFEAELTKGSHELSPVFEFGEDQIGAFYCVVRKLP